MTARTPDDKRKRALQLRTEPDMRLVDSAERLGVHPSTISRLEHAAGQPRRRKHRRGSFYGQATEDKKKPRPSRGGIPGFNGRAAHDFGETLLELNTPDGDDALSPLQKPRDK